LGLNGADVELWEVGSQACCVRMNRWRRGGCGSVSRATRAKRFRAVDSFEVNRVGMAVDKSDRALGLTGVAS
jgi:hypothetical protein